MQTKPDPRPRIYLETTVIGYLTSRRSRDIVTAAHQEITQIWWEESLSHFDPYVSVLVLDEAGGGDAVAAEERLKVVADMVVLDVTKEAEQLADALLDGGGVPSEYPEDALHIATATVNGMDYLLTWNFTHINNAALKAKVEEICEAQGYSCPIVCSPEELPGGVS